MLSLDLSQCRPRVGCRPSTARHRRRHVQYTATPTVTQRAVGLLTQPTYTVCKKLKKIRPPAWISSKISDDKQLIFFTRPHCRFSAHSGFPICLAEESPFYEQQATVMCLSDAFIANCSNLFTSTSCAFSNETASIFLPQCVSFLCFLCFPADIDECSDRSHRHNCSKGSVCVNQVASFTCKCDGNQGYIAKTGGGCKRKQLCKKIVMVGPRYGPLEATVIFSLFIYLFHPSDVSCARPINASTNTKILSGTRFSYTGAVQLDCLRGYEKSSSVISANKVQCKSDGNWSAQPLVCSGEPLMGSIC